MRAGYRHDQGFAVTYLAAEDGVLLHLTASTLPDVERMLSPNPTEPERVEDLLNAVAAGVEYQVVDEGGSGRRGIFKRSPASRPSRPGCTISRVFTADVDQARQRCGRAI